MIKASQKTSQKVLADSPVDNSVKSGKKINVDKGLRYPPAFCEFSALSARRIDWRIAGGCFCRYGKNLMKSTGYGVSLLADKLADSWRAVLSANPPHPVRVADAGGCAWRIRKTSPKKALSKSQCCIRENAGKAWIYAKNA